MGAVGDHLQFPIQGQDKISPIAYQDQDHGQQVVYVHQADLFARDHIADIKIEEGTKKGKGDIEGMCDGQFQHPIVAGPENDHIKDAVAEEKQKDGEKTIGIGISPVLDKEKKAQ